MVKRMTENLLYKELSYQIHGAAIEVRKDFGSGHKEKLYQTAFAKELTTRGVSFEKEKAIKIHSPKDGQYIGLYRPDFIADKKIIVEVKAEKFVSRDEIKRVYDYLRNSTYELVYLINFASPRLFVRRIIYTNDRKPRLPTVLVFISLLLVLISGVLPAHAGNPIELFLMPDAREVVAGEVTRSDVWIDTSQNTINAADLELRFDPAAAVVLGAERSGSIFDLWVEEPRFSTGEGTVKFTGGSTTGFSGRGVIGQIYWRGLNAGQMTVAISEESAILLHDGRGTKASISFRAPTYTIAAASGLPVITSTSHPDENTWYQQTIIRLDWPVEPGVSYSYEVTRSPDEMPDEVSDEPVGDVKLSALQDGIYYFRLRQRSADGQWSASASRQFKIDATPPEPFEVKISRDPRFLENRYFLSFAATDATSGVARYEIREGDAPPEVVSQPPYVLRRQARDAPITVRAIDRAGNERAVVIAPLPLLERFFAALPIGYRTFGVIGLTILLAILLLWWLGYPTNKHEYKTNGH